MSNLIRYGFRYRGIESADKIFGEAPDGKYVKFDDIKELRSSTDVQQLKAKIRAIVAETVESQNGSVDAGELLDDLLADLRVLSAI